MYPDMLVFRREGNKIKIDIFDPHDDSRADAAEKATDLANFARRHGSAFGRIEMIRIVQGKIERLLNRDAGAAQKHLILGRAISCEPASQNQALAARRPGFWAGPAIGGAQQAQGNRL
jgi:hypothetical protein